MNEPSSSALPDELWIADFVRTVRQQRSQVQECLAAYRQREQSAQAQFVSLMRQWQELIASPASGDAGAVGTQAFDDVRAERDALSRRLSETEAELAATAERMAALEASAARQSGDAADENEYRRRYEAALDDLRELKARYGQLEQQLRERSPGGAGHPGPTGKTLDWEAEKRRIVAALEAEGDGSESDENQRAEIQEIVRTTGRIVTQRDREILELKQLLQDQSANLGSVAVGAAALGAILDQDAIIQEERENLRRLQSQWEEKLRKAEIEISIERAKLARERAELDERLRSPEGRRSRPDEADGATGKSAKAPRGRWLSRLGLKDPEDGN